MEDTANVTVSDYEWELMHQGLRCRARLFDNMVRSRNAPMIERFDFTDLRELFAKANEEKSGDQLAGIAARSERERVAAKRKLADMTLREIVHRPLIEPSEDDVTRLIL